MSDPASDLIKAMRAALVADATVSGIVAGRVYSDWNSGTAFPRIHIATPTLSDWEDSCGPGVEAGITIHCFAKGDGAGTARNALGYAVKEALDEAALPLDGNELLWIDYVDTIPLSDPDDPTIHQAVVRFTAVAAASP